jgi:tetratricopeptide (TPR) repeat protein
MRRALAALALLAAGSAHAEPAAPRVDGLPGSPEELAGFAATEEGKWVRARELGEKVLREHPDSFAGHYIVGVVMHYGEGDLARSAFHLDLAMKGFEALYGPTPDHEKPWRWHEAVLRQLAMTYGEMDRPAEELAVFDRFDKNYQPKKLAERVWPLMKLRRYDDARAVAKVAVATGDRDQKIIARSDLCAAECEAGSREHAWQACTDALAEFRGGSAGGMVEFSNASEAALSVLRYDDAERFLAESIKRAVPDSWGNPYQHLGMMLVSEGRVPEAIAALKGGQELRLRRPAWLDQHGQARLDQSLAQLLLVVGQTERAVQIAKRAVDRPDRMGVNSGTDHQATAASAIAHSVALRELAARHLEDAVTAGFVDGVRLRWRAADELLSSWRERRRAAVLLADEDFLERSLRPYYVGGVDVPPWLMSEVVIAVGGGVTQKALERARLFEHHPGTAAFFDALEAEAAFQRGDDERASIAAERALTTLPHAEALLQARVAAIAGETARRRGDQRTAGARLSLAMQKDPGVLRRLGLRLPVAVEAPGDAIGREAASLIRRSPRFRVDDDALFRVVIAGSPEAHATLLGPGGEVIADAVARWQSGEGAQPWARRLVSELHRAGFALKSDLSQEDLTTLDGSPTAQRADHQVKSLLDAMGPER